MPIGVALIIADCRTLYALYGARSKEIKKTDKTENRRETCQREEL